MPRLFVFVPVGRLEGDIRIIRFGFTNTTKPLHELSLFKGLNTPEHVLLDEEVPNAREAFEELQNIIRGVRSYAPNTRFNYMSYDMEPDFRDCLVGYNFRTTRFTVEELTQKFAVVAAGFRGEEVQPAAVGVGAHVEHNVEIVMMSSAQPERGELVQMRNMSIEQAAAILCGVPGSVEAVLEEYTIS